MTITLNTPTARRTDLSARIGVGKAANENAGHVHGMTEVQAFAKSLKKDLTKAAKAFGPGIKVSVRCTYSGWLPSLRVEFTMPGSHHTPRYQALKDAQDWDACRALSDVRFNATALQLAHAAHVAIAAVHYDRSDSMTDSIDTNFFRTVKVNGSSISSQI